MENEDHEMAALARREAEEIFGMKSAFEKDTDKSGQEATRRDPTAALEENSGRQSKWSRPAAKGNMGRYGKGSSYGRWHDEKDPWSYEPAQLSHQEQEFLKNVARMLMRHESEMRLLRQDTTWMMFVDTGDTGILSLLQQKSAQWQQMYQQKQVTTSLQVVLMICAFQELATRIQSLMSDSEKLTRMHTVGWLVEGETALNPKWVYQQWSPE
ncbi:unnamed protein product, partial [Symbiodinium microadriaticum]